MASGVPDGFETLAREVLAEVAPPDSVGELLSGDRSVEDVVDLAFASRLPGYIGWRWTVSMAQLPDAGPSVLEVELLPSDGALLAPPWVPWAERLAEYRRAHPEDAEAVDVDEADDELDDDELDEDELDADEDVLDDEADDVLDGVDFEAAGDADDDEALEDEGLGDEDDADETFDHDDDDADDTFDGDEGDDGDEAAEPEEHRPEA